MTAELEGMKKFILLSMMISILGSTLLSCGSPPKKEEAATTEPEEEVPVNGIYEDALLYLSISSKWESGGATTSHGACQIRTTSNSDSLECDISIPEGQMYYSDINFTMGTKFPQECATINFAPYYYRIDDSDTDYRPPGEKEPAKCATEAMSNSRCWGGAATQIVTGFPNSFGMYFMPSAKPQTTYTLGSGNTVRWTSGKNNRLAVNNLVNRTSDIPGRYVANSMNDYYITCTDLWARPIYTIKLNLVDADTKDNNQDATQDQVPDWQ